MNPKIDLLNDRQNVTICPLGKKEYCCNTIFTKIKSELVVAIQGT